MAASIKEWDLIQKAGKYLLILTQTGVLSDNDVVGLLPVDDMPRSLSITLPAGQFRLDGLPPDFLLSARHRDVLVHDSGCDAWFFARQRSPAGAA